MQRLLLVVLSVVLLLGASGIASTYRSHSKTFTARHSTPRRVSAPRPYYGGGHHTKSHGGKYPGSMNAHHKNGHYQNWRTGNSYGVHQAR